MVEFETLAITINFSDKQSHGNNKDGCSSVSRPYFEICGLVDFKSNNLQIPQSINNSG